MGVPSAEGLPELLRDVRRIAVRSRRLVTGALAGGWRSAFRGAGISFEEVREYAPGDDPRTVDWNVTARVGRPYVKKYVDERQLALYFLVDVSASLSAGFGARAPRRAAAGVCASLALAAVRHQDRTGLIAFGARPVAFVPARRGLRHALRIVRDVLALPPAEGPSDPGPALAFATRALRRGAVVVMISDFLFGDARPDYGACALRHDLVAVRLASPELAAPSGGLERLRDPETGRTVVVDWSDAATRAAFAARTAELRARTDADLRRAGVDVVDATLDAAEDGDPTARPLLAFFRMRAARGAKR